MLEHVAKAAILSIVVAALAVFSFALGGQYEIMAEQERMGQSCKQHGRVFLYDALYRCEAVE